MSDIVRQQAQYDTFEGRFQPTTDRLSEICETGAQLLSDATESELCEYAEIVESADERE